MSSRFDRVATIRVVLSFFLFFSTTLLLVAQDFEVINGNPFSPEALIRNVFLGEGVEVLNVTYEGDERSVGYFRGSGQEVGMTSGIVMTTGYTVSANGSRGVNEVGDIQASVNVLGAGEDPDMEAIAAGVNVNDITRYTITFRPSADTLRFRYAFGSEEYPEFVCSQYNDIFGFFISGPGVNGGFTNNAENIALIPGTNLPVRINNLNGGVVGDRGVPENCSGQAGSLDFSNFFIDNNDSDQFPVYDGITTVLTATAVVVPCEVYTIKLVICDVQDSNWDSGVFLEAKSFSSNATNLQMADLNIDGAMAEGCRPAQLTFTLSEPATEPTTLDFEIFGTATNGTDYTGFPSSITIPPGDSTFSFELTALEDNQVELDERIQIALQKTACERDTFTIIVKDNPLTSINLPQDTALCPSDSTVLSARASVESMEPPRFESTTPLDIIREDFQYESSIFVQGVQPSLLIPELIKAVCIDSLEHERAGDLDIYLIGPNEQVLELSTDNGEDGGPGLVYSGTCFTVDADRTIPGDVEQAPEFGVPFRGNFLPESPWEDFIVPDAQTNGEWKLAIIDDNNRNLTGTLYKWSICFNPTYAVNYAWDASPDLSCTNCAAPNVLPQAPTTYTVRASDSYGCEAENSVTVDLLPVADMSAVDCGEPTDTSLTISWALLDGASGYEVRIDGGPWISANAAGSHTFLDLNPETTYLLEARALFDCPSNPAGVSCTTLQCIPPVLEAEAFDIICEGEATGRIALSTIGNRGPFQYFLDDQALPGDEATNLLAGTYELRVLDQRLCEDTVQVEITEPEALLVSEPIVQQTPSCVGSADGQLASFVSGGWAPYSFQWSDGSTDSLAFDLSAGIYRLTVTDANGCERITEGQLEDPPLLFIEGLNLVEQSCLGPEDGSASVRVAGGTPPYSYNWPSGTDSWTGVASGSYDLQITDFRGCTIDTTFIIGREPDVAFEAQTQDVNCFGVAEGVINIRVTTGQSPYQYNWSAINIPSESVVQSLEAGEYGVTVTDARGCRTDSVITIAEPDPLIVMPSVEDIQCAGDANGAINLFPSGGVEPYQVFWNTGASGTRLDGLAAGTYVAQIRDANNCETSSEILLPDAAPIGMSFAVDPVRCNGEANGRLAVQSNGGTGLLDFRWNTGASGPELLGLTAGRYEVSVTDAQGCTTIGFAEVPEPAALAANLEVENVRCAGEESGAIQAVATGGTPAYQYRLEGAAGGLINAGSFFQLAAGTYELIVEDINGCSWRSGALAVQEPDPLSVELGPNQTVLWGDSIQLFPAVQGGTPPFNRFNWRPGDSESLSCVDCPDPWVSPVDQMDVRVRVIDGAGCIADDHLMLVVEKDFVVVVPTGFTPNADGRNDRLLVHGRPDIRIVRWEIFDRWGEQVFLDTDFLVNDTERGWDGNYRGRPLNGGVFLWQAEVEYPDGRRDTVNGQTTLIR